MIRDATPDDLPRIRDLLASANDAPCDIGPVAEEKCFGRGVSGAPRVRLHEHGLAVSCGRYLRVLAVDRVHRGRGIGTALLRDSGAEVIAAEPGNYFTPGVWPELGVFFERRGYRQSGSTWNLLAAVGSAPPREAARSWRVAPDDGQFLSFVERQFGPIWAFEAKRAAAAFYIPHTGFAVIEANNRGLGTFGPFGVAEEHRGRGHGAMLVQTALAELARMGFSRAIIPWTDALSFYRKACGAEAAQRFLTYTSRP